MEFITNGDDTLILVKATANDHESVDELIKTLDTEIARKTPRTIASYELTNLEKMLAIQILSNRFPEITFVTEDNTSRLLTWANPGEHNQIPLILKGLEAAVAVENEKKVEVYNIDAEKMIAADVLDLIDSKLKENLTIQVATATNSLVVRASAAQHAKLKSAVDAVVMQIKPLPKPTSLVYEFPLGNALAVSQLVSPLLSNTTISVAADGKKIDCYLEYGRPQFDCIGFGSTERRTPIEGYRDHCLQNECGNAFCYQQCDRSDVAQSTYHGGTIVPCH